MAGRYDVAQVCLNGHVISHSAGSRPQHRQDFCSKCGAKTIMSCQKCGADIPGDYDVPGVLAIGFGSDYEPPSYCIKCAEPFPWTAARIEAAKELAKDLEGLSPAEQEQLAATIDDLAKDTPMAQVSAGRFRRLALKAGAGTLDAFRSILIEVSSESVKKVIWP